MEGALGISLSGLALAKKEMAITAHNIANANDADYTRLKVNKSALTVGGIVSGVKNDAITAAVNSGLQTSLHDKISKSVHSSTLANVYELIEEQFGAPGDGSSIDTKMTIFFWSN